VNRAIWIVSITAAVILGAVGIFQCKSKVGPPPPPLIAIEKMGQLVSLMVKVSDIVELTENRALDIPWSTWEFRYAGTKVLMIVKGDCSIATDVGAAKFESIDNAKRTVTVVLPAPKVLQARVNHAPPSQGGSHLYAINNQGIEAIIPGSANRTKAIEAALSLAQKKIEDAGKSPDVVSAAKENTEHVLKNSLTALGWSASFKWK